MPVDVISLLRLLVVEIDISQNGLVTHVIRILLRKVLNLGKGLLLLVQVQVHPELLHTDLFGFSVEFFQPVEGIHHLLITLGLIVKLNQRHQRFQSCRKLIGHVFIYGNRLREIPLAHVERSQCLLVPEVRLVGLYRLLQRLFSLFLLSEEHIELGDLIQCSRRSRMNIETMLIKFVRRIVLSQLLHPDSLQEIIIELTASLGSQRITFRLYGHCSGRFPRTAAGSPSQQHSASHQYI